MLNMMSLFADDAAFVIGPSPASALVAHTRA